MPNWTTNKLRIAGDALSLEKLERLMEGEGCFDFQKLIPCPQELLNTPEVSYPDSEPEKKKARQAEQESLKKKYGAAGWYDWCVKNWGTKWTASYCSVESDASGLIYKFETAWAPPTPVILMLSKKFPELTFVHEAHEEGGCWPSFEEVIVNGVATSREEIKSIHEREEDDA